MNFGFVIDNRNCIGCHACTVACKAENDVPVGVNRTWVKYIEKGEFPHTKRFFSVMRCNHCEDAPCITICPTSALYKRPDGIVDFNNITNVSFTTPGGNMMMFEYRVLAFDKVVEYNGSYIVKMFAESIKNGEWAAEKYMIID